MQYEILPRLLRQEGNQFYKSNSRWQPKNLIPDPYRRSLLKDAQSRFENLSAAEDELRGLDRASLYIQILRRMRLSVRLAQFAWNSDDLKFLESITSFFTDYGIVFRYLKFDEGQGRFEADEGV